MNEIMRLLKYKYKIIEDIKKEIRVPDQVLFGETEGIIFFPPIKFPKI